MTNVPLFTSSSEKLNSKGTWLKAIIVGLVFGIVFLVGWEFYWRSVGFLPVLEDDLGIWATRRLAVQKHEEPVIALLGSSRMQLDIDPQLVQELTGTRTVMLAIDGNSPLPVLQDLATDNSFHGLVLCSLLPQWLADDRKNKSRSAKWVRKYHKLKWSSWIETYLSILLQTHFVFRYPGLLPDKLWEKFLEDEFPIPPYAPLRKDRYRPADYSKTDIVKLRANRIKRQREIVAQASPPTDREFTDRLDEIRSMVQQIQGRGGQVIFLRLPASGGILALEEKTWPRADYWDRFVANISAPALHFADYPELARFNCPDGSHLDYRDARTFTRSLVDILDLR